MLLAIFRQFFLLGCMSFGGPAAHLGYFKRHFVDTLNWLTNTRYAQLISLSQALPGPGSSQVSFAIGVERAGVLGGIAAFIGFTLPSFLIMVLLAVSAHQFDAVYFAIIAGLKLFAVVIVADATLSMAKSFCTSITLKLLAVLSTLALILLPMMGTQIAILVIAATIGAVWPLLKLNTSAALTSDSKNTVNWLPLGLFALLLCISFIPLGREFALFTPFYQAGAMVFGGGHVVLPVLQAGVPALSDEQFLSAYASAQAIPGPMFTIATTNVLPYTVDIQRRLRPIQCEMRVNPEELYRAGRDRNALVTLWRSLRDFSPQLGINLMFCIYRLLVWKHRVLTRFYAPHAPGGLIWLSEYVEEIPFASV